MKKKLPAESTPESPTIDLEAVKVEAYEEGYSAARTHVLRLLMQANDNPAVSYADALHWAGCDKDGVFWLSLAARDLAVPTHIANKLRDICRTNRRLSMSAVPPYRVTRIA